MKKLLFSFSARKDGNCDEIARHLAKEEDKIIYFRDLNINSCSNCDYECFDNCCKYRNDDIYNLLDDIPIKKLFLLSQCIVEILRHYILF